MLKRNRILRKLDPLLLMTLLVSLSVFMTSAVDAADKSFFSIPDLSDLFGSDAVLTKAGRHGTGVYMSFQTPADAIPNRDYNDQPGGFDASMYVPAPDLFLSVRIPW